MTTLDTKIKIPEDVFNDLMTWRSESFKWPRTPKFIGTFTLNELSLKATNWWSSNRVSDEENNQRLIAIIRWVNGEDIFEIETNNKWIVRSKEKDDRGKYFYVSVSKDGVWFSTTTEIGLAKKFDSKEEADKYTNVLTESVQYN